VRKGGENTALGGLPTLRETGLDEPKRGYIVKEEFVPTANPSAPKFK